jgi:hypothetical protein
LDAGGDPGSFVALRLGNFVHFGWIHSYSARPGDHRRFDQGHSGSQTGSLAQAEASGNEPKFLAANLNFVVYQAGTSDLLWVETDVA